MRVSCITDEFTQDFDAALEFAKENRLQGLELRSIDDRPIHSFSPEEARQWKQKLDRAGLAVSNLSSSFYKCQRREDCILEELEKLEHLCDLAEVLGCSTIRGFCFFREEGAEPEKLAESFSAATRILRQKKKMLLLEADPSVNTSSHTALAGLLKLLDPRCYGAVFDPGNSLFDPFREEQYPFGYEAIRPYLRHVHIKDVVYEGGEPVCVAPGQGLVNYPKLLKLLRDGGYDGWLSLEPHYRKNLVLTEEQMRNPAGNAFSAGGEEAVRESAQALIACLKWLFWEPQNNTII